MARYIKEADIDQPIDVVSIVIEDFIYHNHFQRSDWNGEMVYSGKDSHGKMRFFKYSYVNRILRVEAWMKGTFGGEKSIETGGGSKADYRESIERLLHRLRVHTGNIQIGDYVGHDPMNHQSIQPAHSAQSVRPVQQGGSALLLSVIAVFFGFWIPLFGLIMGIISKKRLGQESVDARQAKTVKTLATVAMVLSILSFAISFILPFIFAATSFWDLY